jgi:hypothetical protein
MMSIDDISALGREWSIFSKLARSGNVLSTGKHIKGLEGLFYLIASFRDFCIGYGIYVRNISN